MKLKCQNKIFSFVIGIAGAVAMFQTLSLFETTGRESVIYSNSFLSAVFCIFSVILYQKAYESFVENKKIKTIISLIYSFALATALCTGRYLETVENVNVGNRKMWVFILILTIYFAPFVSTTWQWIEKKWNGQGKVEQGKKSTLKDMLLYAGIIFLCWLPVFLAFYPGAFVYDAGDELFQVETRMFTTHHPLTHVLLLGGFVRAGKVFFDSYNVGIALYTLLQMLLLAVAFGYTVCFIKNKINNSYFLWGTVAFYGLFPVIPMYAVCSSKDTIFTAAFLVVVIKMLQFMEEKEAFFVNKGNIFVSIAAAVAMMLFRNNGMYAYVVWAIVLGAICVVVRKDRKAYLKMFLIMVISAVCFVGCSKALSWATKATPGGKQEIMTVPIQQMVRTYIYSPETYTQEEKEVLFEMIPEEEMHLYNARISDLVKSKFDNEAFQREPMKYLQLWAKIGMRKPLVYLNAWLMTSYGYWYPDAVNNVYGGTARYTFTYDESSYFGFETEQPGVRESKFPWLEEQYRKMSLELYQQRVPGVSMLFSLGFFFWGYLFVLGFQLQKGDWEKTIALSGILLLWLTAILGPTYLVRYVLILWFAAPVLVVSTKE